MALSAPFTFEVSDVQPSSTSAQARALAKDAYIFGFNGERGSQADQRIMGHKK
jgi:hypothetical protein